MAEDQQIEHGREHGCGHGLEADLPETQHFLLEQGLPAVHAETPCEVWPCSFITWMKTSSRSARRISTSSGTTEPSRSAASRRSTSLASLAGICTMRPVTRARAARAGGKAVSVLNCRSEEHTSELQSPCNLVC